jgi:hypothetical protein
MRMPRPSRLQAKADPVPYTLEHFIRADNKWATSSAAHLPSFNTQPVRSATWAHPSRGADVCRQLRDRRIIERDLSSILQCDHGVATGELGIGDYRLGRRV